MLLSGRGTMLFSVSGAVHDPVGPPPLRGLRAVHEPVWPPPPAARTVLAFADFHVLGAFAKASAGGDDVIARASHEPQRLLRLDQRGGDFVALFARLLLGTLISLFELRAQILVLCARDKVVARDGEAPFQQVAPAR